LTPLSVFKTDPFNQTWVFLRATFNNIQHLFLIVNDFYELFYLKSCMGLRSVLWAVIQFYGTLYLSMGRHPVLWNVIPVYGPSSGSMERYTSLWAVIQFYGTVIPVYGLSSQHRSFYSNMKKA